MARVAALALAGGMAFVVPAPRSSSLRASATAGTAPSAASAAWGAAATATAAVATAMGAATARSRGQAAARKAVGICLPLTDKFDPLDLGSTDAKMDRYTAVEIKHGRVAMI
eukprot:CAMPEP_0181437924 /NCGR_PEP_ID=MMETSP1110-20121109/21636_1 /TAXON_ID=174948 /ORGANISM="Symbiodinium sp., Strain CCMP421" /LENGTH=111 /DNA_ID=CAMNT_0023561579 /DNA_START=67 /DNA_END=399 /DNA_ORIENTATION=+